MSLPHNLIPSEDRPEDTRFAKLKHATIIPKPPFTMLIVAPIGQGKSSLTYSMLDKWYGAYFDELIIYNGTKDSNDAWLNLPAKEVILLNEWDEEEFFRYAKALEVSQLRRIKEGKPPVNVCILFDDMVTDHIFSRGRSTALDQFIIKIRHIPASLIMTTQSYKLISSTSRRNMTQVVVLAVNQDEIEKVAEEHSGLLTRDEFIKMYKSIITKRPRNYLVIDYRASPEERFKERFETILKKVENTSSPSKQNGSRSAVSLNKGSRGKPPPPSRGTGNASPGDSGEEDE
jgi:hypothetical protein